MTRRYIVVGAGAVGAALAAGLEDAGVSVVLVSRGATLDVIRERGLRYEHDGRARILDIPVLGGVDDIVFRGGDVIVLTTKTQDAAALVSWASRPVVADGPARYVGDVIPVVTVQNGLEAERIALRHFRLVIGATTLTAAQHLEAGRVHVLNAPKAGQIIIGAYPSAGQAPDAARLVPRIASDLAAAHWLVQESSDILRWKAWKLVQSVTFAVEVFAGEPDERAELRDLAESEARAVLTGAGFDLADPEREITYDRSLARIRRGEGTVAGLSPWQSFERGSGSEIDYLNGEVVLQAGTLGLRAPVNAAIQRILAASSAAGDKPGARHAREVLALAQNLSRLSRTVPDLRGTP